MNSIQKLFNLIKTFIFILVFLSSGIYSQEQSASLRESIKSVKSMIESLGIYDQLEKKRLYGAVGRQNAIEFKLQASPIEKPTSVAIGIATDGMIQEMQVTVFLANKKDDTIRMIRNETVIGEREWVFETMDSSDSYLIDIRVLKSRSELSLVEIIHGFYYGIKSNSSFSTTDQKTNNPSFTAPKQDADSLSPNDVYNRFEIFKKDLSK